MQSNLCFHFLCDCFYRFTNVCDRLFDVFNSKYSKNADIFKRVLDNENKAEVFDFLTTTASYLKSLKIEESQFYRDKKSGDTKRKSKIVSILHSKCKTAFRGFIVDIEALLSMYREYIEENSLMTSISTYLLQQDIIEMFFGKIRAKCGFNNNPNVHQFKGAYRQLSTNIKIQISPYANCRYFDSELPSTRNYSNITTVSSRRAKFIPDEAFEDVIQQQKDEILEDVICLESIENSDPLVDFMSDFSIFYAASRIETKISENSTFFCMECRNVFAENEKSNLNSNIHLSPPCTSTYEICKTADRFMKLYDISAPEKKYDFKVIYCLIFRALDFENLFVDSLFDCDMHHKYQLIKCIVGDYVAMTAMHKSKQITMEQHDKVLRQHLNRLVVNSGQ